MFPLPILCYHKCGPIGQEGRRLNVEPRRLEAHVRFFLRRGAEFVPAGDLAARWPERGVCLTFDDGYVSTLQHAFPALERLGVRASVYVVTDKVGGVADWEGGDGAPLAGWPELQDAQRRGFEVGCHTATHARMDGLSEQSQRREVADALAALREHGVEPRSFCHPYGRYDQTTLQVLRSLGVPIGLALGKRPSLPSDPVLELPRIVVAYSDGVAMLVYKMAVRPRLRHASGRAKRPASAVAAATAGEHRCVRDWGPCLPS
ncbi:MAG: polysaccharide deacetylase family protein [Fimbriimonadales bacterium]